MVLHPCMASFDEVRKLIRLFECGKFINILLHLLFQLETSIRIDNMFQESIVQKVQVEVQNRPDLHKSYWWWNVHQLFFNEASMLGRCR